MFEESLVESTSLLRTRSRWPVIVSITAQAAILGAVIAIPLLYPDAIPLHALRLTTIPAPPMPKPPTPPPQVHPLHVETSTTAPTTAHAMAAQVTQQFRQIITMTGPGVADPALAAINIGNMGSTLPPGISGSGPAGPNISVAPSTPRAPAGPIRVTSGVTAGMLLAPIQPFYPPIAKVSRTEGTVVIHAIISKTGHIESAEIVSGPAILSGAALEAVQRARYRPYLLNNVPTEVETTISINFRLSNS